jgi:NitT/TauT family transport system substrate-binding protein
MLPEPAQPTQEKAQMRRRLVSALAITALIAVTAACGDDGAGGDIAEGESASVKVGAIPIVDVAPLHLGVAKGFFKEEGLDVQVINTTGGAAAVPGVVSGQFDFAFGNVVSLVVAKSQGLELQAIAEGNSSTGIAGKDFSGVVVPKDSSIKDAAGLAGKTVAVNNLKNVGDTTVRASIRKAGGDPARVSFVEMPFPEMPAAVEKKQVDAAWIVEPFFTLAQDQGARVVASNFVDTAPNMTVATYFTSQQTIAEKPQLTERFTRAIKKSLQYAQDNPDEARQALLTYTQISPEVAERLTLPAWPQDINKNSVQRLADLMQQDGLVPEKVDVAAILP